MASSRTTTRSGRFLSPEQNERARALLRDLLRQHDDNQSKVAPLLGVSQPTLSAFLSGRQGTSYGFALRLATAMKVGVDELLGEVPSSAPPKPPRLRDRPEWPVVVEQAKRERPFLPDEIFERVGRLFDDDPVLLGRLDSIFVGEVAQAFFRVQSRTEE